MIHLLYPSSTIRRFQDFNGFLVPLAQDEFQSIELDVCPGYLNQGSGIHGENAVQHTKADGELIYDPLIDWCTLPTPTPSHPDLVTLRRSNSDALFSYGICRGTKLSTTNISSRFRKHTVLHMDGSSVKMRSWSYSKDDVTSLISMDEYEFTEISHNSQQINYSFRTRYWYDAPKIDYSALTEESAFLATPSRSSSWRSSIYESLIYKSDSMPTFMTIAEIRSQVRALCVSETARMFSMQHSSKHIGTLAAEAVESIDYVHTNMISFFLDLRDVKSLIPKLSNLKKLRTMKGVKVLSDEYLSVKYGVLPTISDLQEIVAAVSRRTPYLDKNGFQIATAGFTETLASDYVTSKMTQRVKVAISNEERGLLAISDGLEKVGLMPNLKNIWDLVPYSFALDWFVDIGSLLESVDSQMRIATLDVQYCTWSKKLERTYNCTADPDIPFLGTIQWVHYHRLVSAQAPVPPLSFQAPLNPQSHWLEASALLVQRAKFKR